MKENTTWDLLISDEDLDLEFKRRKKEFIEQKVNYKLVEDYKEQGWEEVKRYKNGQVLIKKPKKIGDAFEDEVWSIFYKMGFKVMNKGNQFKIAYTDENSKQIDVIAIDNEVCLLIECKESEKYEKTKTWKTDLESIYGIREGLFNELRKEYPNRKFKYIFATKNFLIGDKDEVRMKEFGIANFDYEVIQYYQNLVNHLQSAARYQLLGQLFSNQKINGLDIRVPAIEGKMGGMTYYTFVVEPEKLLKLSYILHRNKANHSMMPTYQRLINKKRLADIRKFVNEGGYFPNSLVVAINNSKGKLTFERANTQIENSQSKVGILHLPQLYRSIYIIDGQHRLYGYSDTEYGSKNTIPVVAFVGIDKKEQLKLFMDINENQKAVPKSLRNTLNIDMLWDSDNPAERSLALQLGIAQDLGENKNSPLRDRIVTGENTTNERRCITTEYIKSALKNSDFLNEYKKNGTLTKTGTFDKNDNVTTEEFLTRFLIKYFDQISTSCSSEWDKGDKGYLSINNTTYALICVLNDIVNIVLKEQNINVVTDLNKTYSDCKIFVDNLCDALNNLNPSEKTSIKEAKGGGAKKKSYRIIQIALHEKYNKFINDDLKNYIETELTDYTDDTNENIISIRKFLLDKFVGYTYENPQWFNEIISDDIRLELGAKKGQYEVTNGACQIIEIVDLEELKKIITDGSNWKNIFSNIYCNEHNKITKTNLIDILLETIQIKNKISTGKKALLKDYQSSVNALNKLGIDTEDSEDSE